MPLTPRFLFDVETNMQIITAEEFQRAAAQTNWRMVAKERPSQSARERLIWLLDTARIQYVDRLGADVEFEDLVSNTFEFENKAATAGFQIDKVKFDDLDGGGLDMASAWSRQIGAKAAYWPQQQVWSAVRSGDQSGFTSYDGQVFFSKAHPLHPFDTSLGTFANLLAGSAASTPSTDPNDAGYPGACPIDATNAATLDVAFNNLQKAFTYIRSIKMPDGETPRFLRPAKLFVPPALSMRAQQLTNSKFIAAAAASGGGSADVEAVIQNWGIGQPVVVDELQADMSLGSDTAYYIGVETLMSDQMGAIIYSNREPFSIVYNSGMTDAQLQRANKIQWTTRGRNVVAYGHPYLLFKVSAT